MAASTRFYDNAILFANKIPFDELFDEIKKITDLPDLKFNLQIEDRRDARDLPKVTFTSQDISELSGFLKLMFKELYISNFSSQIKSYDDGKEEDDYFFGNSYEDTAKFYYWCSVCFSYKHPAGGSNGYSFFNAEYYPEKGWEFYENKS